MTTNTANVTAKHYPILIKACDGTLVRVSMRLGKSISKLNFPVENWCAIAYRDVLSWDYYIPTQHVNVWVRIKRFETHNNIIGEPWRFRTSLLFVNEQSLTNSNSLLIGCPIKEIVADYEKELTKLDLC